MKIFCHGILINQNDEILFLKRNESKLYGGLWDLPGGKVESGENYYDCLIREFKEETNIDIEVDKLLEVKTQIYKGDIIVVLIFLVKTFNNYEVSLNNEHTDYLFAKSIVNKNTIWYL